MEIRCISRERRKGGRAATAGLFSGLSSVKARRSQLAANGSQLFLTAATSGFPKMRKKMAPAPRSTVGAWKSPSPRPDMCIFISQTTVRDPVEVYFDDFTVEHKKSPIVQMDDYYPFGLTYNSYQRENLIPNSWKLQGQEHINDLDLGWNSFK